MSQMASSGRLKLRRNYGDGSKFFECALKVTTVAAGVAGAINKKWSFDVPPLILVGERSVASRFRVNEKMDTADSLLGEEMAFWLMSPSSLRKKEPRSFMLGRMSASNWWR